MKFGAAKPRLKPKTMTLINRQFIAAVSLRGCRSLCIAALCLLGTTAAQAAKPGDPYEWSIPGNQSKVTLRLRFCPRGEIRPGRPNPANNAAKGGATDFSVVQVREFYIGETEVTLQQFRAVLGAEGLQPMLKNAKQLTGSPQLLSLLQTGQNEPVYLVGLESAVQFCARLQENFSKSQSQAGQATIEGLRFRLPTHVEWQYAARGAQTLEEAATRPHFNRWVTQQNLAESTYQKCKEVWAASGQPGTFSDHQESYLTLSAAKGSAESQKAAEVFEKCFQKAFNARPRNASGIGEIAPVGMTVANNWQIYDMHDNVTEWVLAVPADRTSELWPDIVRRAQSGNEFQQASVFLAGGCFGDTFKEPGALARFTIWGGPVLGEGSTPQPFEYSSHEIVQDKLPGFRILMERNIREDWLYALRTGIYSERRLKPAAISQLATSRQLLIELADKDHPAWNTVVFYEVLAAQAEHRTSDATTLLTQFATVTTEAKPAKKKSILDAFASPGAPADSGDNQPQPTVNDDQMYWQLYQQIVVEK